MDRGSAEGIPPRQTAKRDQHDFQLMGNVTHYGEQEPPSTAGLISISGHVLTLIIKNHLDCGKRKTLGAKTSELEKLYSIAFLSWRFRSVAHVLRYNTGRYQYSNSWLLSFKVDACMLFLLIRGKLSTDDDELHVHLVTSTHVSCNIILDTIVFAATIVHTPESFSDIANAIICWGSSHLQLTTRFVMVNYQSLCLSILPL
jgi:hypothetical protein